MITLWTCSLKEWADRYGDRLLALDCSPEYVAKVRADILSHTEQVGSTYLRPGEEFPKGLGHR